MAGCSVSLMSNYKKNGSCNRVGLVQLDGENSDGFPGAGERAECQMEIAAVFTAN